jgi:hypothetical protein
MNIIPDGTLDRGWDEENQASISFDFKGAGLKDIPSLLRKYYDIKVDTIQFTDCSSLTHVNFTDIKINCEKLFFNRCDSLISMKTVFAPNIRVSGTSFSQIEILGNPNLKDKVVSSWLDLCKTNIKSLYDIKLNFEHTEYYYIYMPKNIKSMINNYPDDVVVKYIFIQQDNQLTDFFGLKIKFVNEENLKDLSEDFNGRQVYVRVNTQNVGIDYFSSSKDLSKYFPKIKNVLDKFNGYKSIIKKYPNLLTDDKLSSAFEFSDPNNLEEFENSLNKLGRYNVDMNALGILINLLLK